MRIEDGSNLFVRQLRLALHFSTPKAVSLAIGKPFNGEIGLWCHEDKTKRREPRAGVYLAMCQVPGEFGRMMRAAVVTEHVRTVLPLSKVYAELAAVMDMLSGARTLLEPVASCASPPRIGQPQIAHALLRLADAREKIAVLESSLEFVQQPRRGDAQARAG